MKNKTIKSISLAVMIAFCISFAGNEDAQRSNGAPVYVTNAPGEQTCSGMEGGKSCHSGGIADNSGQGTPSISFSGGTTYVPGKTYTVTATISHPIRNRFGFEITSLKDSNNTFCGTIVLLDSTKTQQVQPTTGSFLDRIYVTHLLAGTYPTTNHLGQWSYKWTAPPYNAGNISFYACYLAANNNNDNDPGDETYWKKITVAPSVAGIAEADFRGIHTSIYPNPCSEFVYVLYYTYENMTVKAELFTADGKFVQPLIHEQMVTGLFKQKVSLQNIVPGMYLIKSTVGTSEKFDRICIQ